MSKKTLKSNESFASTSIAKTTTHLIFHALAGEFHDDINFALPVFCSLRKRGKQQIRNAHELHATIIPKGSIQIWGKSLRVVRMLYVVPWWNELRTAHILQIVGILS